MSEQGKYPVIFISLKDLKEDTWEECIESIKDIMHKIFNEYSFLREKLNIVEKRQFDKIWEITGNERNFKTSLLDLSNYLNKYYGEKVIILIDEYDAPIINAFDKGYYNEAINFFQTFYSSALKTNNSLKYGILTGITRIIKEGIFSGLNNLYVNTNVSGNTLLENMLNHAGESVYEDLKRFTDGESIEKYISDGTTIKSLLSNDDEIWQLLLYSGYLTKDEKQEKESDSNVYNLKIPNKEIRKYFGNMFLNRFFGTEVKTNILIKALEGGDIKKFEETLGEIMINMLSHFDLDKEMEKIYQVFMIGLVGFLMGKYEIISNDESGYGRYDLAMIPIKSNEKAYLMEFKISKTKKGMEESAEKALKQIDEKKYDTKLRARGIKNILKIGIAFYGKEVKVVFK